MTAWRRDCSSRQNDRLSPPRCPAGKAARERPRCRGTPLVDFSMRLGEGSGAVLAVPMVRSAVAALNGIAQLSDLT